MGYRSTFVTEDLYVELPDWFYEKYKDDINFGDHSVKYNPLLKPCFPLSSKWERKFYAGAEDELFIDLAKVLRDNEDKWVKEVQLVLLHEDGEVDRVIITPDKVILQRSLQADGSYNPQLGGDESFEVVA